VTHPFFSTSFRRDPHQPQDLHARIDAQLVERIEEAVDFICLDALVQARRAHGLPEPVADSDQDRAEFTASVRAFLTRLNDTLLAALPAEQRRRLRLDPAAERAEPVQLKMQAFLARELPDYWQRFDAIRVTYTAEYVAAAQPMRDGRPSGGERRNTLRRLFGHR
jgi:hypothetical protein